MIESTRYIENNKRVAKNTAFLYGRMLFSMLVSLYTARVVLRTLGEIDFGLYNVVGGVITVFAILKGVISSGSQRFLCIEIGKGNTEGLKAIFSATLTIYFFIGIIVFVLSETIGLWFVNTQLVIPEERLYAANFVYQASIISMLLSIIQLPYSSAIISHERMDIYGYIGIGEPILRLLLVIVLPFLPFDKLIAYSILVLLLSSLVSIVYIVICRIQFEECKFSFSRDKQLCKELLSFTSWNLIETVTNECNDQGQNILLNIFFGPKVNAARAVAMQVNGAIRSFAINFVIAQNPQITKYYAQSDIRMFHESIMRGAKFSFIILSMLIVPVLVNTNYMLSLWLGQIPEGATMFCQLVLISTILRMMGETLFTGIQATGKIKKYQLVTNSIIILNLPICYLFFKLGYSATVAFTLSIIVSVVFVVSRLCFLSKLTSFPIIPYVKCMAKCIAIDVAILSLSFLAIRLLPSVNFVGFTIETIIIIISLFLAFWFLSISRSERKFFVSLLPKIRQK